MNMYVDLHSLCLDTLMYVKSYMSFIRAEVERLEVTRADLINKIKEEVYNEALLPLSKDYTCMLNNCHV